LYENYCFVLADSQAPEASIDVKEKVVKAFVVCYICLQNAHL